MEVLTKDYSLFADKYFKGSRLKVKSYAKYLLKNDEQRILLLMRRLMQDILLHLEGFPTYGDMVKNNNTNKEENIAIGKRKLTEMLSLIEELDTFITTNYIDLKKMKKNEYDLICKKSSNASQHMHFETMVDFLNQIINLFLNYNLDTSIPDPETFDFETKYYREINTHNDEQIRGKYKEVGKSVNAIDWIESKKVKFILNRNTKQIKRIKELLAKLRDHVKYAFKMNNIDITDQDLLNLENSFIIDKIANKTLGISTIQRIIYTKTIESMLNLNRYLNDDIEELKKVIKSINYNQIIEKPIKEEQKKDDEYTNPIYPKYKIGKIIKIEPDEIVFFYNTPYTNKGPNILERPAIIIGYTVMYNDGIYNYKVATCRTETELNDFITNYNGNFENIKWVCETNTNPVCLQILKQKILKGERIDDKYITCYIDENYKNNSILKI